MTLLSGLKPAVLVRIAEQERIAESLAEFVAQPIAKFVGQQIGCTLPDTRRALNLFVIYALVDFLEMSPELGVDPFRMNELFWLMAFCRKIEVEGDFSMSNLMGPLEARIEALRAFVDDILSALLFGEGGYCSTIVDNIEGWVMGEHRSGHPQRHWLSAA